MRNKLSSLVVLSCLALPCAAALAESTADTISKTEAETSVLKARARKLEVEASIAAKRAEIQRYTQTAKAGDPTLRSVEGVGKTVYATLQLASGVSIDAKVGDVLPNGMKVISIRPNEVIVQSGKKRIRLGAGALEPTPFAAAQAGAALPVPALGAPR
jgi:type IV pilus biogenesis protein PilP